MSISPHHRQPEQYYSFESVAAGKVLDISQDSPNKGQLIIYENHHGKNQQFAIIHSQL
jgi:hypothetical protein